MVFEEATASASTSSRATASAAPSYMHYHADYNTGTNTIYAGGDKESYLLLPVIPPPAQMMARTSQV